MIKVINLKDLIENQNKIYNFFKEDTSNLHKTGTNVSNLVKEGEKAYIIGLLHPKDIADTIGYISGQINKITPVVRYGSLENNVHTTLNVIIANPNLIPEKDIINSLIISLEKKLKNLQKVEIFYPQALSGKSDVIAIGDYGKSSDIRAKNFYTSYLAAQEVAQEVANQYDLNIKPGKMAHTTVARYLEKMETGDERLKQIQNILGNELNLLSRPKLFVGTYNLSDKRFIFENKQVLE